MEQNLMRLLAECQEKNQEIALLTVISADDVKSCPLGAMMLVDEKGEVLAGGFGNEVTQKQASEQGKICIRRGLSRKVVMNVDYEIIEIFVNAFCNQDRLIIAGAGTVALNIYRFAKNLGYRTTVIDNRAEMLTKDRFPDAYELLWGDIVQHLSLCSITENTDIVIATHHHEFDEAALQAVVASPARYIGVLGNSRRAAQYLSNLDSLNLSQELLERVYSPIGLDLGGKRTVEIALAVVAEMQAVKYQHTGGFASKNNRL